MRGKARMRQSNRKAARGGGVGHDCTRNGGCPLTDSIVAAVSIAGAHHGPTGDKGYGAGGAGAR
jgi:hypothetical protein